MFPPITKCLGACFQAIQAILSALSPDQVLGLEVAEFQVPPDAQQSETALDTVLEMLSPLLSQTRAVAAQGTILLS